MIDLYFIKSVRDSANIVLVFGYVDRNITEEVRFSVPEEQLLRALEAVLSDGDAAARCLAQHLYYASRKACGGDI